MPRNTTDWTPRRPRNRSSALSARTDLRREIERVAKLLMALREQQLDFSIERGDGGGAFRELFDHPEYVSAPPERQREMALGWAQELYDAEVASPIDATFGVDLREYCRGRRILDLGCYIGGRTVRWLEKYEGSAICGVDIDQRFLDVADAFARQRGANASFHLGVGEELPFADERFEVILSQDTFEHVQDLPRVLQECRRVLHRGGYLILTFPPFYAPTAHHLDLATRTPFLHWFFSYPTLLHAYFDLLEERGDSAAWYRGDRREPLEYECGYTINGTTAAAFQRLVRDEWDVEIDAFRDRSSRSHRSLVRSLVNISKNVDLQPLREMANVAYVLCRR
jgi:SAM-dependent methyltransferase